MKRGRLGISETEPNKYGIGYLENGEFRENLLEAGDTFYYEIFGRWEEVTLHWSRINGWYMQSKDRKLDMPIIATQVLFDTVMPEVNKRAIVLDIKTTGQNPDFDEILQISIIDDRGRTLLDRQFKPQYITEWSEAEKLHHITPEDVYWQFPIQMSKQRINKIFANVDTIIGYNIDCSLQFLKAAGIEILPVKVIEIGPESSDVYGYDCRTILNRFKAMEDDLQKEEDLSEKNL